MPAGLDGVALTLAEFGVTEERTWAFVGGACVGAFSAVVGVAVRFGFGGSVPSAFARGGLCFGVAVVPLF